MASIPFCRPSPSTFPACHRLKVFSLQVSSKSPSIQVIVSKSVFANHIKFSHLDSISALSLDVAPNDRICVNGRYSTLRHKVTHFILLSFSNVLTSAVKNSSGRWSYWEWIPFPLRRNTLDSKNRTSIPVEVTSADLDFSVHVIDCSCWDTTATQSNESSFN